MSTDEQVCRGPFVYNHFAKVKPTTTNGVYGYEIAREICMQRKEVADPVCARKQVEAEMSKTQNVVAKLPSTYKHLMSHKPRPGGYKKCKYFVAPKVKPTMSLIQSETPKQHLEKLNGCILWHAISGVLTFPSRK